MDYPQFKYVDGLETKPYKIKPYQCTKCEGIFDRLGAYLIHAKGMKSGICPDEKRLTYLGLKPTQQQGFVVWEQLPTQQEQQLTTQIIENRQSFSLNDFKSQPQGENQ